MKIIYCSTDEAPRVAWYSWSPIVRAFSKPFGIEIEEIDTSLGALLISELARDNNRKARLQDPLDTLVEAIAKPGSVLIKPPCISANDSQIRASIDELRTIGPNVPDPFAQSAEPATLIKGERRDRLWGSVINKLLRQGTMVRELNDVPSLNGQNANSGLVRMDERCEVSSMADGDFRSTEQSMSVDRKQRVRIEFVDDAGNVSILKKRVDLSEGDIASFSTLEQKCLKEFLYQAFGDAKSHGLLFSLQLKSNVFAADEYIFTEAVRVYCHPVFEHFGDILNELGIDDSLGISAIADARSQVSDQSFFQQLMRLSESEGPDLAVNAGDRASHLHTRRGSSVARGMADAILSGGRLRDRSGALRAAKFVIPDTSYAGFYRTTIDDFVCSGILEPERVQNISIVGMTKDAAEEYGAQETTFWIPKGGDIRVVDELGEVVCRKHIDNSGIWRMVVASASAIDSWVATTIEKAISLRRTAVFWLDCDRPHHHEIIKRVRSCLELHHQDGNLDATIMGIDEATRFTFAQLRANRGVIVACGNVLRDYISELIFALAGRNKHYVQSYTKFPNGGYSFEVGTGGTAPQIFLHFQDQNFLRWNPTGDAIAFVAAYREVARLSGNPGVESLAKGLMHSINLIHDSELGRTEATNGDTRWIHFYLAKNWADWMASHSYGESFARMAEQLSRHEGEILRDYSESFGRKLSVVGHYFLNQATLSEVMRPSEIFNSIIRA
jgi:isocitrate dehydrogenase